MDKQPICNQTNCKLIISSNLEKKISVCCRELPENEWSGTLFYSIVSGKFGKDLVLKAEDFYLRDIGSHTYTEFDDDADAFNYQVENDLIDCIQGLIHSHCSFNTFFSGIDANTLDDLGHDMPHFLSLIVNNAGTYCAKITRRIPVSNHYITFNGKEEEYEGNEVIIQSFPVSIEFEDGSLINTVKSRLSELRKRTKNDSFENTLWDKSYDNEFRIPDISYSTFNNKVKDTSSNFNNKPVNSLSTIKETSSVIAKEDNKNTTNKKKNKEIDEDKSNNLSSKRLNSLTDFINKKMKAILYGSFIFTIKKEFDEKDWCKNKMKESFESNFQDIHTINSFFTLYFDNLIGLCLDKFPEIEDTSIIGDIVKNYLSKLPYNIYISSLEESLEDALYEYTF